MPPRILLAINNLETAGMKHVLASIVRKIDRTRFTPAVLVNRRSESLLEQELMKIADVSQLMLRSEGVMKNLFGSREKVKSLRNSAALIHDFDYSSDFTGAWLARRAGIKYVVEKTNLSIDSWRWKLKLGMASQIICLSAAQQSMLQKYSSRLSLIHTGVDIKKFSEAKSARRSDFGLDADDSVLVCVAHLVPVKGYEDLIDAVSMIAEKFPKLKVVAVGQGNQEYTEQLKSRIEEKKVRDKVIFTGPLNDVAPILKMADGKILATRNAGRREAFGAALVEAMAAGLPVIATRSGGPEEIVVENKTGFLVEAGFPEALAEGIERFLKAKSRWSAMGGAAFDRARQLYDEDSMVRAYESVYVKTLES